MSREERYIKEKIFQDLESKIDMCPTEIIFNLMLLKLNFFICLQLKP